MGSRVDRNKHCHRCICAAIILVVKLSQIFPILMLATVPSNALVVLAGSTKKNE